MSDKIQEPEITDAITPEDVEWSFKKQNGTVEQVFENEYALAHLLINGVVFLGTRGSETEYPEEYRRAVSVWVLCSDLFAWACADAEDLPYAEIEPLYRLWKANPSWGPSRWCALHRKLRPQQPVIDLMKKAGAWDAELEALPGPLPEYRAKEPDES